MHLARYAAPPPDLQGQKTSTHHTVSKDRTVAHKPNHSTQFDHRVTLTSIPLPAHANALQTQ